MAKNTLGIAEFEEATDKNTSVRPDFKELTGLGFRPTLRFTPAITHLGIKTEKGAMLVFKRTKFGDYLPFFGRDVRGTTYKPKKLYQLGNSAAEIITTLNNPRSK